MEFWFEVGAKLLEYGALLTLVGALALRWLLLPRVSPPTEHGRAPEPAGERSTLAAAGAAADRIALRSALALVLALTLRAVAHTTAAFGMADAWSLENLSIVAFESQWGGQWQPQMLVAIALVVTASLGLRQLWGRIGTVAATLIICFRVPGLGHAADDIGRIIVHGTHIVAAGLWVGTLACVVTAGSDSVQRLRAQLLRAFAPVAMFGVSLLAATGAVAAWSYLGPISNLWTTEYGRLLGVKLIVVLDVLALGGINWLHLHRRGQAPPAGVARAEVMLAVAVVALTAWLTETAHP